MRVLYSISAVLIVIVFTLNLFPERFKYVTVQIRMQKISPSPYLYFHWVHWSHIVCNICIQILYSFSLMYINLSTIGELSDCAYVLQINLKGTINTVIFYNGT